MTLTSDKIKNDFKTVLITGATSGIGSKVAIKYAEEGWNILCHYNSSEEKAVKLREIVCEHGVDCYLFEANLSDDNKIQHFVNKLEDFDIDGLVNNAGTYEVYKHFSELSAHDLTSTFRVNAFAPMLITTNIFMHMRDRGFGRIVNISSIAAKYGGSSFSMHYGCSKLALEGMTKTLAREGAEYNVLINTIRPGVIDTDFHKKFPKDMSKRLSMIPMKKAGMPEDVANLVFYLGSNKNNYITNEIVTIAGGE